MLFNLAVIALIETVIIIALVIAYIAQSLENARLRKANLQASDSISKFDHDGDGKPGGSKPHITRGFSENGIG